MSGGSGSAELRGDTELRISSFGEHEAGELYVVDLERGEMDRLTDPSPRLLRRGAGQRLAFATPPTAR